MYLLFCGNHLFGCNMDNNNNFENRINDSGAAALSLEEILAEFKAEEQLTDNIRDEAAAHSHAIVMEALGQTVGEAKISSALDFIESVSEESLFGVESKYQGSDSTNFDAESEKYTSYTEKPEKPFDISDDTRQYQTSSQSAAEESESDASIWTKSADEMLDSKDYAPPDDYEDSAYANSSAQPAKETDIREKLLSPLVGLIAASSMRREEKRKAEKARLEEEAKHQIPEMSPEIASRLYFDQAASIKLRCFFASALCLVLVYLSYGLPAMGILGSSIKIRTLVCLVFELVVMLVGLDIFTNGIIGLFKRKPGPDSLIAVSCIVSVLDALYIIISGDYSVGLPFCAVSALSMTFALWGYYLNCKSFSISFRTAAIPKSPSVIVSEDGGEENGRVLVKAKRPITGFVRKSEEADIFEKTYAYFTPILLIFSVILSLFCFFASEKCDNLIHTLSATISICASFSAVFGFAFPFYVLTKRLARSGVAIAGYSGGAELGRISRVVIKDKDLFPARTVSIANISVSEGFYPDKVTSYTASMIAAAGIGIAHVFTELMKKNGYTMQKVEDFACHEGGGIVARINGDMVYVGSSGFMQLMGIRLQKGSASKSAVYTAINDTLAGVFEISYVPVTSVQRGLVTLLRGKNEPVFAVRDFNVTPLLVKQKFRLPKESYDFPSFADRYRISSDETEDDGSVVAMFSRGGLNSVAGLIKRGRAFYNSLLFCVVLSVLGAVVGMVLMLTMCWSGVYESASSGNAMSFMILWLVPVFVISFRLKR